MVQIGSSHPQRCPPKNGRGYPDNRGNVLSADPFLLGWIVHIVLKRLGLAIEQVQPIHGAYPEIIVLIQIKNVDMIITQSCGEFQSSWR